MSQSIYSVTQVNVYIRNMFVQDFMLKNICIRGELSNCKYHTSGHIYFTLKDERSGISCVMFSAQASKLNFKVQEGQKVIVTGAVDTYERDGKYQLYAKEIILDGIGLLYQKFEVLKRELEDMGMFSPIYKKPIPKYNKTIGVVTAKDGAAVRDIIQIAKRRNPYIQIIVYPALVQGLGAKESIVNGIHALEKYKPDVIIVGRGGGSIEDLWAFNEEIVAKAIFDCEIPVISAVGHETDVTIADYVADFRAPTPSAAAEIAVFDYTLYGNKKREYQNKLLYLLKNKLDHQSAILKQYQLRLEHSSPKHRIINMKQLSMEKERRLKELIEKTISVKRYQFQNYIETIKGLSPLKRLNEGFSYVEDGNGHVIKNVSSVKIKDKLRIHMANGEIKAVVEDIKEVRRD